LPGEAEQLKACEEIIERGLKIFLEVGFALISIRDRRLYRAEFDTWEEYCQERFAITARRATQLCAASETVRNLKLNASNRNTCSDLVLPANEAQARPLSGLPPEEQHAAWEEAVKTAPNGRVTARHVEQIVQKRREAAGQIGTGVPISAPDAHAKPHNGALLLPKAAREELGLRDIELGIAKLRSGAAAFGTADSEAFMDLLRSIELAEKFCEKRAMLETLQASRT